MNKNIVKIFGFFKSTVQFLQIITILMLMFHLILWTQNLLNAQFGWLKIFTPFLTFLLEIGAKISNGSITFFQVVFEYKYVTTIFIYIGIYYFWNLVIHIFDIIADKCDDTYRYVKKTNENNCNIQLRKYQEDEESLINEYKIFVSAQLKKKFSHPELGYNLEEQINTMNKFLISKTCMQPIKFEDGFVYSFRNFHNIDNVLNIFFRLIKSSAPLDYVICLQVVDKDEQTCMKELKELIDLRYINKITILSNSAYRYKFNESHRYGTSQLGLFQKGDKTIELFEFVEIL